MATTPAVKVSTETKSRGNQLLKAIAETIQAGKEGKTGLENISKRLQTREKEQHAKRMKRK